MFIIKTSQLLKSISTVVYIHKQMCQIQYNIIIIIVIIIIVNLISPSEKGEFAPAPFPRRASSDVSTDMLLTHQGFHTILPHIQHNPLNTSSRYITSPSQIIVMMHGANIYHLLCEHH